MCGSVRLLARGLYSYDNHPFDISLEHFSVEKDEKYVIPMIKEILEINPDIYLFASSWKSSRLDENRRKYFRKIYARGVS